MGNPVNSWIPVNSKAYQTNYRSEQGLNGKTVKVLSDYLAHWPVWCSFFLGLSNVKNQNITVYVRLVIWFSSKCRTLGFLTLLRPKKKKYILFYSLWETSQTLFWNIFGLVDLENFELTGIKEFTRFSGLLMFGAFSVINVIVLLNLLIAMMNHSYQLISVSSVSHN